MKYTELHRIFTRAGWQFVKQDATSHRHYIKDGIKIIIPFHGAKEVPKGLLNKLLKDAGLK